MDYQEQKGNEPNDKQLSAYCAQKGLLGRGGRPVSPANLRRHFLHWRIYNIWAEHRKHTDAPPPPAVAQTCTEHAVTAQYGHPITPAHITEHATEFERRWQATHKPREA
ncbi:hypothetical protein ACWCQK_40750 [Streptomyces sp. NPDC002306]